MRQISLYNTATKRVEALQPLQAGAVRIYSCGPTVYSRQHIGNLRTYAFTDLLVRTLRHFGYDVRHVVNVTDVGHLTDDASDGDDKMERAARDGGVAALDVAERYFTAFRRDLARINVAEPTLWCRATRHIEEQIALARRLEERGFTYRIPDGLYFDTSRDPGYGALAGLAASRDHSRVTASADKRNPADFALWKLSPANGAKRQLEWESPWGTGFPGWHLECSAMATKYLGTQFDIHTGGVDHVPVHHVNEIAQSENASGVRPWVRHWLHAAWLLLEGAKISKSAGRAPSLDDLEGAGVEPGAFRYYLLTAHYRATLSFDPDAARAQRTAWRRLARFAGAGPAVAVTHPRARALADEFDVALADDLDAPRALGVLWRLQRDAAIPLAERATLVARLGGVLGLDLDVRAEHAPGIDALVAEREVAREHREFARADAIRAELAARGVVVEDTPGGPRWRRA